MKCYLSILIILLCSNICLGQSTKNIAGTVTDTKGIPVPHATVVASQSKKSTITNEKGDFRLTGVIIGETITISSMGYKAKTITVGSETNIKVQLEDQLQTLSDVVVIAYGEVRRQDLTGSVGSVNIEDIQKAPVVSFEDALAGRVAGVQVTSNDGQPGSMSNIVIRGGNSITQSNSPLYVVDGFPLEDPDNNAINPDDIASIEILKDASSTAIYGARGANGVVIITTKQGKTGDPVVTYNNWMGQQQLTKQIPVMSAYEFVKYQNEINPTRTQQMYFQDGRNLDTYKDIEGVNWQDQLLRDAFFQNHSLAVRGGTSATKYALSGSYLDQNGVVLGSGYKRYQGRFQIDQRVGKKFKIGINTNYTYSIKQGQIVNLSGDDLTGTSSGNASSYLMYSAWGYRPVIGRGTVDDLLSDPFDSDLSSSDLRVNPAVNAQNVYNYTFGKSFYTNAFVEYSFFKYFKLKIRGGITETDNRIERFNNSKTASGNPLTIYGATYGLNGSIYNSRIRSLLNENLLTYNRTFNRNHRIDAVVGLTAQRNSNERNGYSAILLPNEVLGIKGLDQGTVFATNYEGSYATLASFLGRVNYSFQSKYLFTFSFRGDGSSKFSPNNRWGYFPSGAFAWNMVKEDFMKNLSNVSTAKLRTSYGITGNNRVPDFSYLSVMQQEAGSNSGNTNSGYYFNGQYIKGMVPVSVGNEDLRWERTANLDIGLDLGFLKDRISFTADYYHKKTTDLLIDASLPTSYGYLRAFKNIGVVTNRGLEFSLNTVNIESKKFEWTSNFNIAFNNNKIIELNNDEPSITTRITSWNSNFNNSLPYIALPGYNVALFYGFVFDGLYQIDDFIQSPDGTYQLKTDVPNNGNASSSIKPGHVKYKDLNGDGIVDANDQTIIGTPTPKHIGGFTNNFRYKQFDLNVFLQWSYGNDVLNANRIVFEGAAATSNLNMFKTFEDRWTMDNQSTLMPAAGGSGPNVYSSRTIEDASFLRLKTVSLGYNLPSDLMKKWGIKSIRAYTSANNLATWTKYSGMDPEVSVRNTALTPGFDWSPYPRARTIVLGLNVTL